VSNKWNKPFETLFFIKPDMSLLLLTDKYDKRVLPHMVLSLMAFRFKNTTVNPSAQFRPVSVNRHGFRTIFYPHVSDFSLSYSKVQLYLSPSSSLKFKT